MVRVLLRAVRVDLQSNTPVLLLQETQGEGRTLPIFIGSPEATAIAYALQGVTMPRPLTHDLMRDTLGALDVTRRARHHHRAARVPRTTRSCTSCAARSARSCPAGPPTPWPIAVRTETPIFVSDELMESEGIILTLDAEEEEDETPDELVGQFRQFLDSVRPEDFEG